MNTGFPLKWHLRNKQGNSILMTCHYPDLVMVMPQGKFVSTNQKHQWDLGSDTSSVFRLCSSLTTASLSGGRCPGCPGASTLAKPAPTQSYAPMAGKPAPSSHEPPCQCNQAPVTLIYQWKKIKGGGVGMWGKRMILRLNEESGHQETLY